MLDFTVRTAGEREKTACGLRAGEELPPRPGSKKAPRPKRRRHLTWAHKLLESFRQKVLIITLSHEKTGGSALRGETSPLCSSGMRMRSGWVGGKEQGKFLWEAGAGSPTRRKSVGLEPRQTRFSYVSPMF